MTGPVRRRLVRGGEVSEQDSDDTPDRPPGEEGAGDRGGLPARFATVALDLPRRGLLGFSQGWAGLSFMLPAVLLV